KGAEHFKESPRHGGSSRSGGADEKALAPSPEEEIIAAAERAVVREEIDRLRPERRRIWILSEDDGKTAEEIAASEGLPLGTVYNLRRLAKRDLAAALRRRERAEQRKAGDRSSAFLVCFPS